MVLSTRYLVFAAAVSVFAPVSHATNCTDSQLSETDSAYTQYATTLDTDCADSTCAPECVATLRTIAAHLPDCEYSDGINYYQTLTEDIDWCTEDASGSDSDGSVGDGTCSDDEIATTDNYLAQYESSLETSCGSDDCSSDCIGVMTELADLLPSCEYTEGINYYSGFVTSIALCSGSWSGSESAGSVGEDLCTEEESTQVASYLAEYDSQYTAACTDDDCSSACLEIMNELVGVIPDCVDTDGVNYNEGVELLILACGGSSSGDVWEDIAMSNSSSGDSSSDESGSSLSGSDDSSASTLTALSVGTATALALSALLW